MALVIKSNLCVNAYSDVKHYVSVRFNIVIRLKHTAEVELLYNRLSH